MPSLQRHVITGGLVWALATTLVGAAAVTSVFDQIADRRFNTTLSERHTQVMAALGSAQNPSDIETLLADPAYDRVYSGRYWQLTASDGTLFTSPSLFDAVLADDNMTSGPFWEGDGPEGPVRGISEEVFTQNGEAWVVSVAVGLNALAAERFEMRKNIMYSFGFVGALGIGAAAFLASALIAPLRKLSDDVLHRWETGNALNPQDYPEEVAPLVSDINSLIERNRGIVDRGRRQAADLAHALKTPSAALRNELETLAKSSKAETEPLIEALDRIDAQITRSLARMRAANAAEAVDIGTDVENAVSRIARLFHSLHGETDIAFTVEAAPYTVAMDQQDLEELIGNILENAFKWCTSRVSLRVLTGQSGACLIIEDDGPGIDADKREAVLAEGSRLDTSVPGTGLGLSISNDLVQAYGGSMTLSDSETLGGLKVAIRLLRGTLG